jgi:Domain of unknown function (DUF4398)
MTASFAQIPLLSQPPRRDTATWLARWPVIGLTFPTARACRRLVLIVSFGLLLISAPVSQAADKPLAPSPELVAAEAALARAESVDAQQYAADALLRARSTFGQAQAKWAERRKADAIALAQLAAAQADYAYARSRDAAVQADLGLRRNEIRELRVKLGIEGSP